MSGRAGSALRRRPLWFAVGVGVLLFAVANPAVASDLESPQAEEVVRIPHVTTVTLDRPVAFEDAFKIAQSADLTIIGFRYENFYFVGELFPRERNAQFVFGDLVSEFGVAPHVTALLAQSTITVDSSRQVPPEASAIRLEVPEGYSTYHSGTPEGGRFWQDPAKNPPVAVDPNASASGSFNWEPTFLEVGTRDFTSNMSHIYSRYTWAGTHHPVFIDSDWGAEFEVVQYNDSSLWWGQTRPLCVGGAGFVNQHFWAVNIGFDWTVIAPFGNATLLEAYGDYNDLFDPCAQQGIAVGLGEPWQVLDNGYFTEVYILVEALGGNLAADSPISGTIQLVEGVSCDPWPWNGAAHTDCMGLDTFATYPGPGPNHYLTLNPSRGWKAPETCWSLLFGDSPYSFDCDFINW